MRNRILFLLVVVTLLFPHLAFADGAWQDAYFQLISSGEYRSWIHSNHPEIPDFAEMLAERDAESDWISLFDLDADGTPELLIRCDYAIEQVDVFTYHAGQVTWLGTVGGDNFFQDIFYYPGTGYEGLFAALGGPVMDIRRCTLENGRFVCVDAARTVVSADGDDTVGIDMNMDDGALYSMLYNTFVDNRELSVSLRWNRITESCDSHSWQAFIRTMQE